MFSATMAPGIRSLATKILNNPAEINIAMSKPAEGVLQAVYLCYDNQKTALINKLIADKPDYSSILIFCSTKKKVSELTGSLKKYYNAESISSDLEQSEREKVLQRYKAGQTRILIATDVLSRGIDIKGIDLVINFDVPGDAEDYVHRVGRTARADATGVALTLVNEKDMIKLQSIEKLIEMEIMKLKIPEVLGKGPDWKVVRHRRKENWRKKVKRKKNRPAHGKS